MILTANSYNKERKEALQRVPYHLILANLGNSKESWIDFLVWNDFSVIWIDKFEFLIQSENDLVEWSCYWNGDLDELVSFISDFKQYKIDQLHASLKLSEFEEMCVSGKKSALEKLFMEPLHDETMERIEGLGYSNEDIFELALNKIVDNAHGLLSYAA
ncbi:MULTISPECIES: hypothetical protein [unclassified Paenibacillus]|uniref:hypothetical protein n=1 Tax=unclassified Paenibacillus TaxID=185978 RepID=UPI0004167C5F|nr:MULTISPECIES: hypothetical protein [unclassified Paenibacillus]KGP82120.1 hypothetical protein P364_0113780 [Paenibacillus sp. MAEPY2]KGP84775.1 hypothetical protein P363_0123050 [Paenibacillus sp. MAEPY1]